MALRDKSVPGKKKATSKDKCYNCHKFGNFGRDYFLLDRKINRNTLQALREDSWR